MPDESMDAQLLKVLQFGGQIGEPDEFCLAVEEDSGEGEVTEIEAVTVRGGGKRGAGGGTGCFQGCSSRF